MSLSAPRRPGPHDRATGGLPTPARLALGAAPPRRVGLLGGSFNPAHEGHLHISREALKRLKLDEIWWLVAPRNPLKPAGGMAPFRRRFASARRMARNPRIKVLDLETRLGTRYTVDTVTALQRIFPRTRFIFIMGADLLAQIRHWQHWNEIFARLPIAVMARPTYCFKSLAELAARRYAHRRVASEAARSLADRTPPAWTLLRIKLDAHSATEIRAHALPKGKARARRKQP
ncbi:MAG TPA: nicotinate-nucleotide adenylyltransferase [Stellaceae bacterium]|nr:nicotinate-nucleotide adenylyltransferase [Stellaceae bacterium]